MIELSEPTMTATHAVSQAEWATSRVPVRSIIRRILSRKLDNAGAEGSTIFRLEIDVWSGFYVFYAIRGPEAVKYGMTFRKFRKGRTA